MDVPRNKRKAMARLEAQHHGGALQRGGSAPMPGAVRTALRDSFYERIPFLEQVADGNPTQIIRFAARDLVQLLEPACTECGARVPFLEGRENVDLSVLISPAVKDRLLAVEMMARYGLGATKELTVDAVKGKLMATIELIREELSPDDAARVLQGMREIWK